MHQFRYPDYLVSWVQ